MKIEKEYLTKREIADILNKSVSAINAHIYRYGIIPAKKIGNTNFYDASALETLKNIGKPGGDHTKAFKPSEHIPDGYTTVGKMAQKLNLTHSAVISRLRRKDIKPVMRLATMGLYPLDTPDRISDEEVKRKGWQHKDSVAGVAEPVEKGVEDGRDGDRAADGA